MSSENNGAYPSYDHVGAANVPTVEYSSTGGVIDDIIGFFKKKPTSLPVQQVSTVPEIEEKSIVDLNKKHEAADCNVKAGEPEDLKLLDYNQLKYLAHEAGIKDVSKAVKGLGIEYYDSDMDDKPSAKDLFIVNPAVKTLIKQLRRGEL